MAHTPGPWGFDDNKPGFVTARGGPDICEVFGEAARADECDFNHALIAAAPELLAALRLAENALDYAQAQVEHERDAERIRNWHSEVQRAIALAEGRTHEE